MRFPDGAGSRERVRRPLHGGPPARTTAVAKADTVQAATFPHSGAQPVRSNEALQFLLIGIPLAALFTVTPLVRFMGWFLATLAHEGGHAAGWLMGFPTVPAISLAGEGVAVHGEPMTFLRSVIPAAIALLLYQTTVGKARALALGALGVVYPLLIFTGLGEMLFLVGGHGGELVIGAVFLWRAITANECHHSAERTAYGMLGWFLVGRNVWLGFSLAFSPAAHATYGSNGSYGLTNDYIRLAEESLGTTVGTVGFAMGVLSALIGSTALICALRKG